MPPAGPTRAPYTAPARGTPNPPRPHASSSSSDDSQDSTPFLPPRSTSLHSSSESSLEPPTGFPSYAHSQAKVHKVMKNISSGAVKVRRVCPPACLVRGGRFYPAVPTIKLEGKDFLRSQPELVNVIRVQEGHSTNKKELGPGGPFRSGPYTEFWILVPLPWAR